MEPRRYLSEEHFRQWEQPGQMQQVRKMSEVFKKSYKETSVAEAE